MLESTETTATLAAMPPHSACSTLPHLPPSTSLTAVSAQLLPIPTIVVCSTPPGAGEEKSTGQAPSVPGMPATLPPVCTEASSAVGDGLGAAQSGQVATNPVSNQGLEVGTAYAPLVTARGDLEAASGSRPNKRKARTAPAKLDTTVDGELSCNVCNKTMPLEEFMAGGKRRTNCHTCRITLITGVRHGKALPELKAALANGTITELLPKYRPMLRKNAEKKAASMPADHQECFMCEKVMPHDSFHANTNRRNGRAKCCKACDAIRVRANRAGLTMKEVKDHMKADTLPPGISPPLKFTAVDKVPVENLAEGHRVCRMCGDVKAMDEFARNGFSQDGVGHLCLPCSKVSAQSRKYNMSHEEFKRRLEGEKNLPLIPRNPSEKSKCRVCLNWKYMSAFCRDTGHKSGFCVDCSACQSVETQFRKAGLGGRAVLRAAMANNTVKDLARGAGFSLPDGFMLPPAVDETDDATEAGTKRRKPRAKSQRTSTTGNGKSSVAADGNVNLGTVSAGGEVRSSAWAGIPPSDRVSGIEVAGQTQGKRRAERGGRKAKKARVSSIESDSEAEDTQSDTETDNTKEWESDSDGSLPARPRGHRGTATQ